jgi:hypothetical protein
VCLASEWTVWARFKSAVSPTRWLLRELITEFSSYYVLVVLCVFGKKADWIKNACLAAVLLFPAVAALHGITLAALHVDGESERLSDHNDSLS